MQTDLLLSTPISPSIICSLQNSAMAWIRILTAVAALATTSLAKEMPPDEARSRELYQSGAMMARIRDAKEVRLTFKLDPSIHLTSSRQRGHPNELTA